MPERFQLSEVIMNRVDVIQEIIDRKNAKSYLEIGVDYGNSFFPVKAKRKVAVDPQFRFSIKSRIYWTLKNIYNITAKFYELTSDDFFSLTTFMEPFDLIFLDGLHTYQQSLNDVINSLERLNQQGIIVMHDCNPPNQAAAYPAESYERAAALKLPGWTGEWCGDVWKTICYLRSQRQDLKVFVLDCDYGLGIITRGDPDSYLCLDLDTINQMTYDDLSARRKELLNLKDENYLFDFLKHNNKFTEE